MTPQEHADHVLQQSGIEAWRPEFGKGTLIRLLRANIAWEIEQAIQEERRRVFQKAGDPILCGVSAEGASWAMENQTYCGCRGLPGHAPGCSLYQGGK